MTELIIDAKYRYREVGRSLTFDWRIYDVEVKWHSVMPLIIIIN